MTNSRHDGEAVNDVEGTAEAERTLVAVVRATFPHDKVPDAAYERVAKKILEEAEDAAWMRMKLAQGLDSLQAVAGGEFADLDADSAHRVLLQIEGTPFFGFIRQTTVVNLYEDEEVWQVLGYEGPSFDKGGYINRGFDDLDWLPEVRVEEYDGEPLPDIVEAVPSARGAANTRRAAVPVGQLRAQGRRAETGRTS